MALGRYSVLAAATAVSLSCGLNYCYSAYAPQLAARLDLSSTQTNAVGAAGNLGVYLSSPLIGRIVDRKGPKPTLVLAAVALTGGYVTIRAFYVTGEDAGGLFARFGVPGLILAELVTGIGSTAGLSSAGNSVARSFQKRRAAALSVVLSGFGLSAFFYSTLSSLVLHARASSDVTPSFLLLLALGSLFSMTIGLLFVRPILREPAAPAAAAELDADAAEAALPDAEEAVREEGMAARTERTPLLRADSTKSVQERNIAGWALLRELDFYLIFLFNGLCAGVGLCYINNLGTVVHSLALESPSSSRHLLPSPSEIALLQSRLVSLLSLFNFLGRLLSGFASDTLLHHRRTRLPRVFFLPLTASLLLVSQLLAFRTVRSRALWAPTALTGLAHGCLFGISGIIGLERFGMRSFSQTNGVLALAPAFFGQATNLVFGRIYDAHAAPASAPSLSATPPSRTCTLGRACYAPAFALTSAMALGALVLGAWLALGRRSMRIRAA